MRVPLLAALCLSLASCPGDSVSFDRTPITPLDGAGEAAPGETGVPRDGAGEGPGRDGPPAEGGGGCSTTGVPAQCDPIAPSGCGTGDCYVTTAGTACVCPFGSAKIGEACFTSVDCAPGNVCQGTTPPGRCRRVCDPNQPTTCQSAESCQPINGQPTLGFCRPGAASDGGGG